MLDVVVVGGGSAGLSAALVLGRARRNVLVIDAGQPRNAPSHEAHSFFTRDGTPPGELLAIGRQQLQPYDTVRLHNSAVTDVRAAGQGFRVFDANGGAVETRKLLFAYGVKDELPDIPGLPQLWGKSVIHCPYCHGWEVKDQPLAVYGRGEPVLEFVKLLRGWSRDLVVCSDGPAELSDAQRSDLGRFGVSVQEERIVSLQARGETLEAVVFADGSELRRRALFMRPRQQPAADLAARLGCQHTEQNLVAVDEWGQTSVAGVFAAGDLTTPMQQIVRAAALAAASAAWINHQLAAEDWGT
jgi:thioredoxin reductase